MPPITQEENNTLKTIREDLDKVVAHQKMYSSLNAENNVMLMEIKLALVGSQYTGNQGWVHDVKELKKNQDDIVLKMELANFQINLAKVVIFVLFSGMVAMALKVWGKALGI